MKLTSRTIFFFLLLLIIPRINKATNYYVDPSSKTSNSNGTLANPWKTIAQVNNGTWNLNPGDKVLFKRGQTFSGQLKISSSGTVDKPIIYASYGDGNSPAFNNSIFTVIEITNKQYIVIDGIQITDHSLISDVTHSKLSNIKYAITLENSPNCTIKNCDISLVGIGINVLKGSNKTTITGNFFHNLRMLVNTPTIINSNDDCGANPMIIGSSGNVILHNRFEECWALSYDYGFDGGAIEFFGSAMNNNRIMYNTAINCAGFIEIGSGTKGVCNNNMVAYNKIINCGSSGTFQNAGVYAININNLQYYNNIVVETVRQYDHAANVFWMAGAGNAGIVVVKNNIFWLCTGINLAQVKFDSGQMVHSNNIYRMTKGELGININNTEVLNSSVTLFTGTSGDPLIWNYRPKQGSIAVNFGIPVGLKKDFSGKSIVGMPDAGILE